MEWGAGENITAIHYILYIKQREWATVCTAFAQKNAHEWTVELTNVHISFIKDWIWNQAGRAAI